MEPELLVDEVAKKLKLKPETVKKAKNLVFLYVEKKEKEVTVKEIVAGAIYIASILCGEKRRQVVIGGVLGIAPNKIGKTYKDMSKKVDELKAFDTMWR